MAMRRFDPRQAQRGPQIRINQRLNQQPEYRDVPVRIRELEKSAPVPPGN